MTEKEQLTQTWQREHVTTMRVLKAYPTDKAEMKPHEKSRSAKDLAWTFASEYAALKMALDKGQIDFMSLPKPPAEFSDIVTSCDKIQSEFMNSIANVSEADLQKDIAFPSGPNQMGKLRLMDLCWMFLMDHIHHRGQFSVYIRLADGKVPSIYGPTADEPWM